MAQASWDAEPYTVKFEGDHLVLRPVQFAAFGRVAESQNYWSEQALTELTLSLGDNGQPDAGTAMADSFAWDDDTGGRRQVSCPVYVQPGELGPSLGTEPDEWIHRDVIFPWEPLRVESSHPIADFEASATVPQTHLPWQPEPWTPWRLPWPDSPRIRDRGERVHSAWLARPQDWLALHASSPEAVTVWVTGATNPSGAGLTDANASFLFAELGPALASHDFTSEATLATWNVDETIAPPSSCETDGCLVLGYGCSKVAEAVGLVDATGATQITIRHQGSVVVQIILGDGTVSEYSVGGDAFTTRSFPIENETIVGVRLSNITQCITFAFSGTPAAFIDYVRAE